MGVAVWGLVGCGVVCGLVCCGLGVLWSCCVVVLLCCGLGVWLSLLAPLVFGGPNIFGVVSVGVSRQ